MRKAVSLLMILAILCLALPLSSCYNEELEIYTCGNGFYMNRPNNKTYKIKELDISSQGNAFITEGYFCSEELGKPYTIKSGWSTVGTVYLAKKSEYYDSTVYDFDLDEYDDVQINITGDMDYVRIHSSDWRTKHLVYINIEPRDIPLDLTLENAQIYTDYGIPVIFSQTYQDINLILKGENILSAGVSYNFTSYTFQQRAEKNLSKMEEVFYAEYEEAKKAILNYPDGAMQDGIVNHTYGQLINTADKAVDLFESVLQDGVNILGGVDGVKGFNGIACIIHSGGISINGTGILDVHGGNGSTGQDADSSLFGMADGGPGGNGAPALCCGKYLAINDTQVRFFGGSGGVGGQPSKSGFGIFGSSGDQGRSGRDGVDYSIAVPRETDK